MSLDLLKLQKQNDPRDGSQLKLPVLKNQGVAPPATNPLPTNPLPSELGTFTRGQGPTPQTPPIPTNVHEQPPTNPLEQVLNPDVSSLINPYAGDLGKLSLGDIQRMGVPDTLPSAIEPTQLTTQIGPDRTYEDIKKDVQTSYEKKLRGMDDGVNQILANPTPIYAFPDPTEPIQVYDRPNTDEWLYGPRQQQQQQQQAGNPFVTGNKGFSQNSTAGAISQGGGLVSRLGNALNFDSKFGEYAQKDINNIGNFLNPQSWMKYGGYLSKGDWQGAVDNNPLFKVFENVGGDNGSYGPGLIGSTFRALDLVDNTVRGAVADLFQLKRIGEKTGNNLYRATAGGQDYSFFQVRSKGASPFALIPEKFDTSNPGHWGLGVAAFLGDAALGIASGKAVKNISKLSDLTKTVKAVPRAATIKESIAQSNHLKKLGEFPVDIPVPKTPVKLYEEAVAGKVARVQQLESVLSQKPGVIVPALKLDPTPRHRPVPPLDVGNKEVTIQPSASIRPEKAPYATNVQTDATPTLVPPKRPVELADEVAATEVAHQKGTALIKKEVARQKDIPIGSRVDILALEDHLYTLQRAPKSVDDVHLRLNLAKRFLEEGDATLGMGYLKSASEHLNTSDFSKYFDSNGLFKATLSPEAARRIVKEYRPDAPPEVVSYVKELLAQSYNTKALFKAAAEDGAIVVDTAGNILETKRVAEALPQVNPVPPLVTGQDVTNAVVDPVAASADVLARKVTDLPAVSALKSPDLPPPPPGTINTPEDLQKVLDTTRQQIVAGAVTEAIQNLDATARATSDLRNAGANVDAVVNQNFDRAGRLRVDATPNNGVTSEELEVLSPVIKPEELVPQPKVSEALQALKNNPDVFISTVSPVSRTNNELTQLAVFLGHIKPRKAPLSGAQLTVLRQQHGALYEKLGGKINVDKLTSPSARIEVQAGDSVAGQPRVTRLLANKGQEVKPVEVPGTVEELNRLVTERVNLLNNLTPENLSRLNEVDARLLSMGPIDYADPSNMKAIQESLPPELRTSTPEGHTLTVKLRQTEDMLNDAVSELQSIQKELADLDELHKADSLDLLNKVHAAPDTHEAGAAFSRAVWDLDNNNQPGHIPLQLNPKTSTEDLPALITDELPKVDWYHGSRVDPQTHDLRFIDPDQNTTLHELGPGLYLTTDPDSAKYFADAQPSNNLPPGTQISELGTVAQVIPRIEGSTLIANMAPDTMIKTVFKDAAIRAGARERVMTPYVNSIGKEAMVEGLWYTFYQVYRKITGTTDTGLFHRFQVEVANGLRNEGYGAIIKLPENQGEAAILNILGRGGDEMPLSIGKVTQSEKPPELLDALVARASAEKIKGLSSDSSKYLQTQARLDLNTQVQSVLKRKEHNLVNKLEALLTDQHKIEQRLEDLAKQDKQLLSQIDDRAAEATKTTVINVAKNPEGLNPCL